MINVIYKIYLPFEFSKNNWLFHTSLTKNEFDLNDIHVILKLDNDNDKQYLIAKTTVESDGIHEIEEISDIKVGKCIQDFFDGLSKGLNNAAFFNVYNGDEFLVDYERSIDSYGTNISYAKRNEGYSLNDNLIDEAIKYVNSKEEYLKQAFLFLKEGEYLVEIGRYSNAIIQFAVMTEFLINTPLIKKGFMNKNGEYTRSSKSECKDYWKRSGEDGIPSFAFSRYVYGLLKLHLTMEDELIDAVDMVYKLRNKLAHGYTLYGAIAECGFLYKNEQITEFNIWDYLVDICDNMTGVHNFYKDNFEKLEL